MTVMPILATPLGIATIPEAEPLNLELNALFTQRAAADKGPAANPLRYCGRDDLLEWPDAPVRRLGQHLVGAVYSLVGSVSEIGEAQLRALRLEARAWFTVVRTNGSIPAANYPMTAWCACTSHAWARHFKMRPMPRCAFPMLVRITPGGRWRGRW